MADTPPAVRHALSDLLKVLRNRREYLASLRDWCANAGPYLRGEGELPEPKEVECVSEGEWERAARRCAKRLRIAGRPDLAEQVLAAVDEAPDMLAALESNDLEQYGAAKQAEWPVLERTIEHVEWLLEKNRELRDPPTGPPRKKRQDEGGKRDNVTANARMIDLMLRNPECRGWTLRQWSKETGIPTSTIADCPTWKELELYRLKLKAENRKDRRHRKEKNRTN